MENKYPKFSWPPIFLAVVAKEQNWEESFFKLKRILGGSKVGVDQIPSPSHSKAATTPRWPAFAYSQQLLARCMMMPPVKPQNHHDLVVSGYPYLLALKKVGRLTAGGESFQIGLGDRYGWPTSRVRLLLFGQGEQVRPADNPSPPSSDILWWIGERVLWNARKPLHKMCKHFLLNSEGSFFSHQFIFTDHHHWAQLRNIMYISMKVLARDDEVVFYVSQISGWKTYCSERLKFQGCWFERFGFLLIFN